MHSGTCWNILDVVEGCRKVDFQVDHGRMDRHTDIRTCWAASSQLIIRSLNQLCFDCNIQVLAHRPLRSQPGAGKYRLKITDGRKIFEHVVLNNSVSGISVPEKFSVIRISNEVPSNVNPHSITAIPGNKFALLLHHYTTLRTGAETGSQIQAASNGASSRASLMPTCVSVTYLDDDTINKIQDTRKIKLKQREEQTRIVVELRKKIAKEMSEKYRMRKFLWAKF